jgi:hypothetical protein
MSEMYPGQFTHLLPLPEWHPVDHLPGVLRTDYRGFQLETRPGRDGHNGKAGLIDGSIREWHGEGVYLRYLLLDQAARLAKIQGQ